MTYETTYTDQGGVEHKLEIDFMMVDNGIGPYQYGSAVETDRRIEPEVLDVRVDGEEWTGETEFPPEAGHQWEIYQKLADFAEGRDII